MYLAYCHVEVDFEVAYEVPSDTILVGIFSSKEQAETEAQKFGQAFIDLDVAGSLEVETWTTERLIGQASKPEEYEIYRTLKGEDEEEGDE